VGFAFSGCLLRKKGRILAFSRQRFADCVLNLFAIGSLKALLQLCFCATPRQPENSPQTFQAA